MPGFYPWSGNKIPHAATKTWCSQTNKYIFFKKNKISKVFLKCLSINLRIHVKFTGYHRTAITQKHSYISCIRVMFFAIRDQAQTISDFLEMYVALTGSPHDCGLWVDSPPLGFVSLPSFRASRFSLFIWGKRLLLNYLSPELTAILSHIPGARIHHVTPFKCKRI